uniref:General transcription factor 3C polypeptide 3 n=1 Tax=Knipowitschia caucasica TaxID=637954 RepID=A0AAV2LDA0_KNICA
MSGFSAELIDYLEGRITFEEFDRRRDERKAGEDTATSAAEDEGSEKPVPSTSTGLSEKIEGVSPGVQLAFASILAAPKPELSSEDEDDDDDDEEDEGDALSYVDDEKDEDYSAEAEGQEDGAGTNPEASEGRKKARAQGKKHRRKRPGEEEDDEDNPTAGDVFALEMELNRKSKKMMRERRNRSKLPRALRGLMGEANIRYARGEKSDAILMCMEIIRQAPMAFEPFSTLTMIYEDEGDVEKALQFGLIAAHLNPSDCDEWIRLAEMSLEQDNIRQAIFCYSKGSHAILSGLSRDGQSSHANVRNV